MYGRKYIVIFHLSKYPTYNDPNNAIAGDENPSAVGEVVQFGDQKFHFKWDNSTEVLT